MKGNHAEIRIFPNKKNLVTGYKNKNNYNKTKHKDRRK